MMIIIRIILKIYLAHDFGVWISKVQLDDLIGLASGVASEWQNIPVKWHVGISSYLLGGKQRRSGVPQTFEEHAPSLPKSLLFGSTS